MSYTCIWGTNPLIPIFFLPNFPFTFSSCRTAPLGVSASKLDMKCSLQTYAKYVAGIKVYLV